MSQLVIERHAPTYSSWKHMRSRCNNPNDIRAHDYYERGITVCERWESYDNFVEDMGERPAGTTIDRIDNDGNYNKDNCKWSTPTEQQRNRNYNLVDLDIAALIAYDYKYTDLRYVDIAGKFAVHKDTVRLICIGKQWIGAIELADKMHQEQVQS